MLLAWVKCNGDNCFDLQDLSVAQPFRAYPQREVFNTVALLVDGGIAAFRHGGSFSLMVPVLEHSLPQQSSHAVNITNSHVIGANIAQGSGVFSQHVQGSSTLPQLKEEIAAWLPRVRELENKVPSEHQEDFRDAIDVVQQQIEKPKPNGSMLRGALEATIGVLKKIPAEMATKVAVQTVTGPASEWMNQILRLG